MKMFNTRLAIRNLVIVTVLTMAYLLGKHFRQNHNTAGEFALKTNSTKHKIINQP